MTLEQYDNQSPNGDEITSTKSSFEQFNDIMQTTLLLAVAGGAIYYFFFYEKKGKKK